MEKQKKPRLLICDIDGVICDSSARQLVYSDVEALKRGDHNAFRISMNAFNATSEGDVLIETGLDLLVSLSCSFGIDRVIFLTARGECGRGPTLEWLNENIWAGIPSEDLIMRAEQPEIEPGIFWKPGMPNFSSVEQKRDEVLKLMETHEVVLALDDKPDIVAMYQDLPINALMVCWASIDCLTLVGDSRSPGSVSGVH